jgi:hypothetical protein
MNIPGFSAEASLYGESGHYRTTGAHTHADGTIQLASLYRHYGADKCSDCAEWCSPYESFCRSYLYPRSDWCLCW